MSSFPRSLVSRVASVALLLVAVSEASSQTTEPETPTEMAKAIGHAIDANRPKTPDTPITFGSVTSHDNVVEVHYIANEARVFPHNDAEREERRLRFAHRYCFFGRIPLFKAHGVVIHQVLTAPDDSAPFEFSIDETTCAVLLAGIKTRVKEFEQNRPKSLDEPKHVPTITVRPNQTERN
jgi:hypothetical protein